MCNTQSSIANGALGTVAAQNILYFTLRGDSGAHWDCVEYTALAYVAFTAKVIRNRRFKRVV